MTTTTTVNVSAIGGLVLTRLLVTRDKGETTNRIKNDLEPLLVHRWAGAALTERLDQTLAKLESCGLVTLMRGKSKKTAPKVVLTGDGRRRGLDFLGVEELKPKTTWASLKKIYLPACTLGLPAVNDAVIKAISSDPGFKALLLKRQYSLPITEIPRLDEAVDALAWQLIGFTDSAGKFSLQSVKTALLNRELGDGRMTDFKKAATRLVAQRLAARRDDSKELREAVLRGWIDREEASPARSGIAGTPATALTVEIPVPPPTSSLNVLDLPSFTARVQTAARTCPTGRFGDSKVFIIHVWRALQSDPLFRTIDLPAFKERLAEANNARLLDLSRADLVQAMDPDDVRESEVHYLNATFHFVRI